MAAYVAELERVLSADRWSRYRKAGADDLSMVVQYLWNVELCQALYHSLGALEMALRNSIHTALTAVHGRPDWYDVANFLQTRQIRQVSEVKATIANAHKPVTPGRVVAGLTFGFWVALLSKACGTTWTGNNQPLVKQAFPYAPVHMRYRLRIHKHVNNVRLLRNRVFHFECVTANADILAKHADILAAIGWISPIWRASTRAFDRFPVVHARGYQGIELKLKQHLGIP